MIESLGRADELTDERAVAFLKSFNLQVAVVTDEGAVRSLRALLRDIEAPRPLVIRTKIDRLLLPVLGVDPREMSLNEQHELWRTLDERVRAAHDELWRTKQLSDFLSGIWAQTYGQIYCDGIVWFQRLRSAAQALSLLLIALMIWALKRGGYGVVDDEKFPTRTQ
jgi:hypothetical protein